MRRRFLTTISRMVDEGVLVNITLDSNAEFVCMCICVCICICVYRDVYVYFYISICMCLFVCTPILHSTPAETKSIGRIFRKKDSFAMSNVPPSLISESPPTLIRYVHTYIYIHIHTSRLAVSMCEIPHKLLSLLRLNAWSGAGMGAD